MRPDPVFLTPQVLPCPACGEPLDEDPDGTSCGRCGGLLVLRVWADRCAPNLGRPVFPPVFVPRTAEMKCPSCRSAMKPVLCHAVASWSCARCRWLFFEGARQTASAMNDDVRREIQRPSMIAVIAKQTKSAPAVLREALGIVVLAAIVIGVLVLEHGG